MNKFDYTATKRVFLEKSFANSGEGMAIVDERGNFLDVNSAFTIIYGYTQEELLNMHISQLVYKGNLIKDFRQKHLKMLNKGGESGIGESVHQKKDGSKIYVERSFNMIKDEDENVVGGLIIIRDITHKKHLEKELRESEEKYRNLFDSANDGILIADKSNTIININRRGLEMLGYSQEELIGKPATIIMPARYQKVDENAMQRIYSTGKSYTTGKTYEIGIVRKDGTETPVEASYSVLKMGEDFIFTMIFRDISERKNLETRLVQSERLKALGEMASGVAHDFNNLLATILGRVQLLRFKTSSFQGKEKRLSTKYLLEGFDIIEKATSNGAEAVRRLQDFTRLTADTQDFVEVNLNELVTDAIDYTKPLWKDKADNEGTQITVIKHLANTILPVTGNPSELREVLINIIKNALDAIPEGGIVTIKTSQDYGFITLSISDTGCGMSLATKEKIFEPFFTTKGPKRSGLGMSVSYGIIKRHRGEISVKSEEGKGTCITIKLPVVQEIGHIRETTPSPPPEEKKARILVIDDEEGVRNLLYELLETAGHDVAIASDGEEGLKIFKDSSFDMVFTDLGMPGISGWEVAKQIKELNTQIPVTLITGWGIQVDEEKKKNYGVDFIISKPFNIEQVASLVQEGMLKIRSK